MAEESHGLINDQPNSVEITKTIRPPTAKDLPGKAYNYWSKDEFVLNPNAALRVTNAPILSRVVNKLDVYGDNPSSKNIDKYLEALADMESDPAVNSTPGFATDFARVRDALIAKKEEEKKKESVFGAPEVPKTMGEWIKMTREQIGRLEQVEAIQPLSSPWERALKLRSSSGLAVPEALDQMQNTIANAPITIEVEGLNETRTFREWLIEEIKARQKLHNRFVAWRNGAPAIEYYAKKENITGEGSLDVDGIVGIAAALPQPGETQLVGDKVSKAFWAYRQIARGLPYDGSKTTKNLFGESLSPIEQQEVHDKIKLFVSNDTDSERLAWRLAHVWREAANGDTKTLGVTTGNSDATSRLTYFENWRTAQHNKNAGKIAGPKETLHGKFPKKLLLPFLDETPYSCMDPTTGNPTPEVSLLEALKSDPEHLLRKIKWRRNLSKADPDHTYASHVSDVSELFLKLIGLGIVKDDISESGFKKFNKLVSDATSEAAVIEEVSPGKGLGYWKADRAREKQLEEAAANWEKKIRKNYVFGLFRSSRLGIFSAEAKTPIKAAAINAGTITYGDSITM